MSLLYLFGCGDRFWINLYVKDRSLKYVECVTYYIKRSTYFEYQEQAITKASTEEGIKERKNSKCIDGRAKTPMNGRKKPMKHEKKKPNEVLTLHIFKATPSPHTINMMIITKTTVVSSIAHLFKNSPCPVGSSCHI